MKLVQGTVLQGRYTIETILGEGGFGIVYLAKDSRLPPKVAIKQNSLGDSSSQKVFAQEANILSTFPHQHLPRVIDAFIEHHGQQKGQYFVMEYIPGESLYERLITQGVFDENMAVRAILPVLSALEYLHCQGIYHRDVKPLNIRITPQGSIFLVDLGLAKDSSNSPQTLGGARGSTPGYSPPEQYSAQGTDARSDLYSVGATLYTLLSGTAPLEALKRTANAKLTPLSAFQPNISQNLDHIITKLLALSPEHRYQTAQEVTDALVALKNLDATKPPTRILTVAPTGSRRFDSPLVSPMRALTDSATFVASITFFLPWAYGKYQYGFLDLMQSETLGYQFESWVSLGAFVILIILLFIRKRISATRTALARWKMILGIVVMLPAMDIILTKLLVSDISSTPKLGSWIALGAGIIISCASIGDIKSWGLPKEAIEPGYAKIIRFIHSLTVILVGICGAWTIYNGYLETNSYTVALVLGIIVAFFTFLSFTLDDKLQRLY